MLTSEEPASKVLQPQTSAPKLLTSTAYPSRLSHRRWTREWQYLGEWWKRESAFVAKISDGKVTFYLASKGENQIHWSKSITSEMDSLSLMRNRKGNLVSWAIEKHVLPTKWAFLRNEALQDDGAMFQNYQAHMITPVCEQIHGINIRKFLTQLFLYHTAAISCNSSGRRPRNASNTCCNCISEWRTWGKYLNGRTRKLISGKFPDHFCRLKKIFMVSNKLSVNVSLKSITFFSMTWTLQVLDTNHVCMQRSKMRPSSW